MCKHLLVSNKCIVDIAVAVLNVAVVVKLMKCLLHGQPPVVTAHLYIYSQCLLLLRFYHSFTALILHHS